METRGNQWPGTQWKPSSYFLCDLLCKETFTFGFNKIKINKNSALTDSSAINLIYPKIHGLFSKLSYKETFAETLFANKKWIEKWVEQRRVANNKMECSVFFFRQSYDEGFKITAQCTWSN